MRTDVHKMRLKALSWAGAMLLSSVLHGQQAGSTAPSAADSRGSAAESCRGGVIKDDGSVETGYGFVPSATEGIYLQRFDSAEIGQPLLGSVCVCLIKNFGSRDVEFDVVLFADQNQRPAAQPLAVIPAKAEGVARWVAEAGDFVEIDVGGVPVPKGAFYLGVRWNPEAHKFLFVCADQSESTTTKTKTFYRENRSPGWVATEESRDPIFLAHRAIMVRARGSSRPPKNAVPNASAPAPLGSAAQR